MRAEAGCECVGRHIADQAGVPWIELGSWLQGNPLGAKSRVQSMGVANRPE
jgi:hypothetical protein